MRVLNPTQIAIDENLKGALSSDPYGATAAWKNILSTQASIRKYWDFITRQQLNSSLSQVIFNEPTIRARLEITFIDIIKTAVGLSAIQLKSLNFLKRFNVIPPESHTNAVLRIVNGILAKKIDYVSADQLCEIFKEQKGLVLSDTANQKMTQTDYREFLNKCRGEKQELVGTPAIRCLYGDGSGRSDWSCLTDNWAKLDIPSCQLAKSRNADPENSDDMLWFCYSKMLDLGQLNRPKCLELTHSFGILSNQLKMNWNCLNRVNQ